MPNADLDVAQYRSLVGALDIELSNALVAFIYLCEVLEMAMTLSRRLFSAPRTLFYRPP